MASMCFPSLLHWMWFAIGLECFFFLWRVQPDRSPAGSQPYAWPSMPPSDPFWLAGEHRAGLSCAASFGLDPARLPLGQGCPILGGHLCPTLYLCSVCHGGVKHPPTTSNNLALGLPFSRGLLLRLQGWPSIGYHVPALRDRIRPQWGCCSSQVAISARQKAVESTTCTIGVKQSYWIFHYTCCTLTLTWVQNLFECPRPSYRAALHHGCGPGCHSG